MEKYDLNAMKRLPEDVVSYIFGKMSWNPQSQELMRDIRHYHASLQRARKIYHTVYAPEGGGAGAHTPVEWLINDIFGFANDGVPLLHGFAPKMYKIWLPAAPLWMDTMKAPNYTLYINNPDFPSGRRPLIWYKIDCYLTQYLDKKPLESQICLFWGSMTYEDRETFIQNCIRKFNLFSLGV